MHPRQKVLARQQFQHLVLEEQLEEDGAGAVGEVAGVFVADVALEVKWREG